MKKHGTEYWVAERRGNRWDVLSRHKTKTTAKEAVIKWKKRGVLCPDVLRLEAV